LNTIIQSISSDENDIHSFLSSDLGAPLPLHISLSRPIGVVTDQKDVFLTSLIEHVKTCGVRPFTLVPCGLDWVPNFEITRWFLVLRLNKPEGDSLNKLLKTCNKTVTFHGQLPLYAEALDMTTPKVSASRSFPRKKGNTKDVGYFDGRDYSDFFHISIGWTLNRPDTKTVEATETVRKHRMFLEIQDIRITVKDVKVKIGNVVTSLDLAVKAMERGGILGS